MTIQNPELNKFRRNAPINADQLILKLHNKHPRDTKYRAAQRFAEAVHEYPEFITEIALRYHSLNYARLTQPSSNPKQIDKEKQKALAERAKTIIQTNLLSCIMPNGKKLADCTGTECVKMGGWLAKIGKQVGPRQLVGAVLSEENIRAVWQQQHR